MSEYIISDELDVLRQWMPKLTEIVRCRDCEHYRFVDRSDIFHDKRHNDSFCLRFVDGKRMEVEPDGYCAWSCRRSDKE